MGKDIFERQYSPSEFGLSEWLAFQCFRRGIGNLVVLRPGGYVEEGEKEVGCQCSLPRTCGVMQTQIYGPQRRIIWTGCAQKDQDICGLQLTPVLLICFCRVRFGVPKYGCAFGVLFIRLRVYHMTYDISRSRTSPAANDFDRILGYQTKGKS